MKLYTMRSSAVRGAKRALKNDAATENEHYKIVSKEGQYSFTIITAKKPKAKTTDKKAAKIEAVIEPVIIEAKEEAEEIDENSIYGSEGDLESGLKEALEKAGKTKTKKTSALKKVKEIVAAKEVYRYEHATPGKKIGEKETFLHHETNEKGEKQIVVEEVTHIPGGVTLDFKIKKDIVRESSVKRPTKLVWHIADEMLGARRKDVIDECIKRGIAFYTARTQYQEWYKIQKQMAERNQKAK